MRARIGRFILAFPGLVGLAACGDAGTSSETGTSTSSGSTDGPDDTSTGVPTTAPDDPTTGDTSTGDTSTGDTSTGDTSTGPIGDTTTGTSSETGDTTTGSSSETGDTTTGSSSETGDTTTGSSSETGDTTGSSTEADESSTGNGDNADCATPDLLAGPPVTLVDGLVAVPIDIAAVDAKVVLDAGSKTALAEATMQFRSGPQAGHPIFDLRQKIVTATLDGVPVQPADVASHDFGLGMSAGLRILEVELPACTDHTLVLTYALNKPDSPESRAIVWSPGSTRVKWDLWMSDLYPARYLEQWFPANLVHDRFPFTLDLALTGSAFAHTVVSNGVVEPVGASHWKVGYPPTFTALSPMLVLVAEDRVIAETHDLLLADDVAVTLELYQDYDVGADLPALAAEIAGYMDAFVASTGAYAHGDRLTVYIWNELTRSMEYDGATTTRVDAVEHELFHSWYGRGVKPASQNDGWIDEAWTMHNVDIGVNATPLDFGALPVQLASPSPWNRVTPDTAYYDGEAVFAGIAAMLGVAQLGALMAGFYELHVLDLVTTGDLERHLYCATDEPQVLAAFHRFVYGKFGEPPAPPPGFCD